MTDLLNVTFVAATPVGGKKPFTVYEIRIDSSIAPSWIMLKRYRDFYLFNESLQHKIKTEPVLKKKNIKLAPFPPKKKFYSMKKDVVKSRQLKLEKYTQVLLRNHNLRHNDLVMDFFNVPYSLKMMLLSQTLTDQSGLNKSIFDDKLKSIQNNRNVDEQEVDLLVKDLYYQKNRVSALHRFSSWYFQTNAHGCNMHPRLINRLYCGYDKYPGLVQCCKLSNSKTAWRGSLRLLVNLMDIERNKYGRLFIQVFLHLDNKLYGSMDLHRHIKDSTQCDGFIIVNLIRENIPTLDPTGYVADAEAWMQFKKWKTMQTQQNIVGTAVNPDIQQNITFNINQYKYKNNKNKININYSQLSSDIFIKYKEFAREADDLYRFIHRANEKYSYSSMRVRIRKDFQNDHWKLKISFIVNHSPGEIYNFLRSSYIMDDGSASANTGTSINSYGWDKKLIDRKIEKKLNSNNYIMYEVYKSFNSPYKFREFNVLRSFINDNNVKYYIIYSSIINNNNNNSLSSSSSGASSSINNNKIKCIMFPSGFEISCYNNINNKSYVSFRWHLTSESVNIITADLLGESDELFQSMMRISSLLTIIKKNQTLIKNINALNDNINKKKIINNDNNNNSNANNNDVNVKYTDIKLLENDDDDDDDDDV